MVKRQKDRGIDIGNDGEQQRVAFQTYMAARMTGYGGESKRRVGKDFLEHPDLVATFGRRFVHRAKISNAPQAIADVKYTDMGPIKDEIARFKKHAAGAFAETFMTAPSPGIVATTLMNAHYDSHEAYVNALATELAKEYRAIHEAGLILQVDAPDLAMERVMMFQDETDEGFVKIAEMHLAAINKACEGIPADRWRLHVCWGNWEGPHVYDIALAKVLPVFYQTTAGALSIEFANPRHQHEYAAFKKHPFPKDKILIPGVIESTSNFVEHPEVVARPHRAGGRGGRRPRARHRLDRLRLRHLRGARMGRGLASCGRSSRPCARAPTLRRSGCGGRRSPDLLSVRCNARQARSSRGAPPWTKPSARFPPTTSTRATTGAARCRRSAPWGSISRSGSITAACTIIASRAPRRRWRSPISARCW